MKFEIDRNELLQAATSAAKAAAKRGVTPMLSNVLIRANDDTVSFVGTDSAAMTIVDARAMIDDTGSAAVPAKLLTELCAGIPSGSLLPVSVELSNSGMLTIKSDKVSFDIPADNAEDYPPVPSLSDLDYIDVAGDLISKRIKQSIVSTGDDYSRPVQQSVYFKLDAGNVELVTADSKRLSVVELDDCKLNEHLKQNLIVPNKSAVEISSIFSGAADAKLAMFKDQLVAKADKITLITRLIEGIFPDYNRVIPKTCDKTATVSKKQLQQALKTIAPIAKSNNFYCKLDFAAQKVVISSHGAETGKAQTEIELDDYSGEEITIAYNQKYLLDLCSVADCELIKVEMTTNASPGLFTAGNMRYIAMPMSIKE